MPRPTRKSTDANAEAYRAALLGQPCPEGFNRFVYLDLEWALTGYRTEHAAAMRELWQAERADLVREWKRRGRRGLPPGAWFDRGASKV